jgi:hypothetical protein
MTPEAAFGKIELHLIRVLQTLISERSVSRAAMRLGSSQPAVSAQLRRLRALTGDAPLVRAGNGMTPTETAMQLLGPATAVLREPNHLFGARSRQRSFDPAKSETTFRIAASDYLDPLFLPGVVGHLKRFSPGVRLDLLALTGEYDYRQRLAAAKSTSSSATGCARRMSCTSAASSATRSSASSPTTIRRRAARGRASATSPPSTSRPCPSMPMRPASPTTISLRSVLGAGSP